MSRWAVPGGQWPGQQQTDLPAACGVESVVSAPVTGLCLPPLSHRVSIGFTSDSQLAPWTRQFLLFDNDLREVARCMLVRFRRAVCALF